MGCDAFVWVLDIIHEAQIILDRGMQEAPLPVGGRLVETSALVVHRQQSQAYTRLSRSRNNSIRHLRAGCAIGQVVEVVELGDRGEPGRKHFAEGGECDAVHGIGIYRGSKRIHGFAPTPEGILPAPRLSSARKRPLKCMAVGIRHAWNGKITVKRSL